MRATPLPHIALALALSMVGGYVDAVGYLNSGGFFLSFMSGNSTRLGIGIGGMLGQMAEIGGSIIATFIVGVLIGTLIGDRTASRRVLAILPLETGLLTGAAVMETMHHVIPALGLAVLAMGMMNTIFQRNGEVSIGLTYMTGTLVKIGQNLAHVLQGGAPFAWVPYLALWCSLVSGAACGTVADHLIGLHAFWLSAAYLACLTTIVSIAWKRGFRL